MRMAAMVNIVSLLMMVTDCPHQWAHILRHALTLLDNQLSLHGGFYTGIWADCYGQTDTLSGRESRVLLRAGPHGAFPQAYCWPAAVRNRGWQALPRNVHRGAAPVRGEHQGPARLSNTAPLSESEADWILLT